jgi:hypothetical protein
VIIEPRNSSTAEKSPLWISFGDKAKLGIAIMNKCRAHNHQKIEAMITILCIVCIGFPCS